MPFNNYMHTAH